MKKIVYLLALGIGISVWSCDVVEEPVVYNFCNDDDLDPAFNVVQSKSTDGDYKILLEDYTGHTCGNCPEAAILAEQMVDKYSGQVIVMAVHAGFFAEPNDEYPADFRTDEGETYFEDFKIQSNPNGMVNRTPYGASSLPVVGKDQWDQAIQVLSSSSPILDMTLTSTYNTDRRIDYIDVNVKFLKSSTSRYKVVAHITENNIISDQKDYSLSEPHVKDYVQKHVLRATAEASAWGKEVNSADVNSGDEFDISFDKLCIDENWDEDNISVIAYVYEEDSRQIVQVEEVHLK